MLKHRNEKDKEPIQILLNNPSIKRIAGNQDSKYLIEILVFKDISNLFYKWPF